MLVCHRCHRCQLQPVAAAIARLLTPQRTASANHQYAIVFCSTSYPKIQFSLQVEIPSTSTPSSTRKSVKQLSLTEHSIREDISGQQLYRSSSGSRPIKTATSFPTYSPSDTQEVLSASGMSTDREDEGKSSSLQEDHTSTDKDIATSTDSIPKQLKKLKISEK